MIGAEMLRLKMLLVVFLLAPVGTTVAQEPDIVFEIVPYAVTAETVSVSVNFSFTPSHPFVGGWSFSVCHDPSELQIESWEWGTTGGTAEGDGGSPWAAWTDLHLGGITQGVVLGGHLGGIHLPAGSDLEIIRIHYSRISTAQEHELSLCALGSPPVQSVLVSQGQSFSPTTIDLVVDMANDFIRGDCNGDGNQDLADSIYLEQYLFLGGNGPECLSACDLNDDGLVNIADSITNLSYLFVGGAAPLPPFRTCGSDPTPDELSCIAAGLACP